MTSPHQLQYITPATVREVADHLFGSQPVIAYDTFSDGHFINLYEPNNPKNKWTAYCNQTHCFASLFSENTTQAALLVCKPQNPGQETTQSIQLRDAGPDSVDLDATTVDSSRPDGGKDAGRTEAGPDDEGVSDAHLDALTEAGQADADADAQDGAVGDAGEQEDAGIPSAPLESMLLGIDPTSECYVLDRISTSRCLAINAQIEFVIEDLFREQHPGVEIEFELIRGATIPTFDFNQDHERRSYLHMKPERVLNGVALWIISSCESFANQPNRNNCEPIGELLSSREQIVEENQTTFTYTISLHLIVQIAGALASCSWRSPDPPNSPCREGQ